MTPASTTTDAGGCPDGDTPDQIVDGLALGEVFLVYKASIHRMEYVGGQFVSRSNGCLGISGCWPVVVGLITQRAS